MISYDTYQNKIKRLAAVKNFIVRFRALFIALFTAIIAFVITFIFIKGMITQDIILPDKIVYGDDYALEIQAPKALFSDAKYQFKHASFENNGAKSSVKRAVSDETVEDDGWTFDLPTRAGDYLVRIVTNKTFGVSYSEPKPFKIEKFETTFEITADSVVYGGMLNKEQYTFELVNGDRLITTGLELDYVETDTELDVANICANADSFVILNKSNEDVTDCYDIAAPVKENVKLSVNPELVAIKPDISDAEYNGKELVYNNELISSLSGAKPSIETVIYNSGVAVSGKPINAGTYTVVILPEKTRIFNGDGVDVTKYYPNINHEEVTFKINPRKVTVTTENESKEYDGTPLVNSKVTCDTLIEGHTHEATYVGEIAVNVKEGGYTNAYACSVTDENGADVTANYQFIENFGKLTILPRNIVVTTVSDTKVYDGAPLVNESYQQVGLLDGHKLAGVYAGIEPAINVGKYLNIYSYTVSDENDIDVTANYQFAHDDCFGTLEIKQREICITSATDSWIYDGIQHNNTETSVALLDESVAGDPVIYGEEIIVTQSTSVLFFTETAVENVIECKIFKDGTDITANYKINYQNGTLSITKRNITIITATLEKEYDGIPLFGEIAVPEIEGGIAVGDISRTVNSVSQINAGSRSNTVEYKIYRAVVLPEPDYGWDVASPLFDIIEPTNPYDVTENYNITYVYGTLTVTPRGITIYTSSPEKIYDGTPLSGDSAEPTIDGFLVGGHVLQAVSTVSQTEAGTLSNDTKYKIGYEIYADFDVELAFADFVDMTENYSISYGEYGTITVKQRPIMIGTAYAEKEYDGTPLIHTDDWEILSIDNVNWFDLLDNHTLAVDNSSVLPASITEVGFILNTVIYKVVCDGEDVTANYRLSYTYENYLEISPRYVTITTADGEWTYNGGAFSKPEATAVYGYVFDEELDYLVYAEDSETDEIKPFVLDHKLVIKDYYVTAAGEYKNECEYDIVDKNGESVINNYFVKTIYGTLTVKPRPLTITTADGHRVYDDTPFENVSAEAETFNEVTESGIVYGHSIEHDRTQFTASVTYVTEGKVENELHFRVFDAANNDITSNYAIDDYYDYGEIYVTKRPISVLTATKSWEFDGNGYADPDCTITEGSLVDGHSLGIAKQTFVKYVTEGEVENEVSYAIFKNHVENLTENYEISYTYGKISRTVRYVQVHTATRSFVYNGKANYDTSYDDSHIVNVKFNEDGSIASYDIDEVAKGLVLEHTLVVATDYKTITNHSEVVKNEIGYIVVDEEINKNYCLIVEAGTLTIDKRPLTITTADGHRVYDNTAYENVSAEAEKFNEEAESGIVKGHRIVHDSTQFTASVTYVTEGKVENKLHYRVFDDANNDVTDNYDIDNFYAYGKIYVTPRPVTISTATRDREYNGKAFSWTADFVVEQFSSSTDSGIVSGHEAMLKPDSDIATVTYVHEGKVTNKLLFIITDGSNDLTENYNLDDYYDYGTLHITPHAVAITNAILSKVYDGTPLWGDSDVKYEGLIDGDELLSDEVISITDIGSIKNDTTYTIINCDDKDITDSYTITYIDGQLTVTVNTLTITTATLEKVYDGTALYGDAAMNDGVEGFKIITAISTEGLGDGDYIKVDSENVATQINVKAGVENITRYFVYTIRDGNEIDVTENYGGSEAIIYFNGTLTVTARPITVTTATDSKEFDGDKLTNTKDGKVTVGSLVSGHELYVKDGASVAFATFVTDGNVSNVIDYSVKAENGVDVTENYAIGYDNGTLTITPRNILVTTASTGWTYNAEAHSLAEYEKVVHLTEGVADTKPALIGEHKLVADESTATVVIDYVVDKDNEVEFSVKWGEGFVNDVSANYSISYEWGKLNIYKRKVTITTESKEREYNGTALTYTEFDCSTPANKDDTQGLLTGKNHKAEVDESKTVASITYIKITDDSKYVDSVKNVFFCIIKDVDGKDISENYDPEYEYGTLTILKRTLTITTASHSWDYDGQYHYGDDELDGNKTEFKDLVAGEFAEAFIKAQIIDYEENGVVNDTSYRFYTDSTKEIETTYCYNIGYSADKGTLRINRVNLVITTITAEKEYDGTALKGDDEENGLPDFDGIVGTDTYLAIADTVIQITDCAEGPAINTTRYDIYRGNVKTTDNYNISYNDGTLTVKKREITIATATDEREFDGNAFTKANPEDNKITFGSLAVGQELYVAEGAVVASITYVGFVSNEIDFSIRWIDGKDVTENYDISYYAGGGAVYGTLAVTPRQITLTTNDHKWVYDGVEKFDDGHSDPAHNSGGAALVLDHFLDPTSHTGITEADEVENVVGYRVLDAEDNDVSENYDITVNYGTLTVVPVKIFIVLNTVANSTYGEEFKGYPADDGMFRYLLGETVNGETLELAIKYQLNGTDIEDEFPVNAGTYTVVADWANSAIIDGYENLENYDITVKETYFTIAKREITISLLEAGSKIYDALAYEFPEDNYEVTSEIKVANGDTLTIAVKYLLESETGLVYVDAPVDAGSYIIEFDVDNCSINGAYPAQENYVINCVNNITDKAVNYVIEKRQLNYTLNDVTHVYIGEVDYTFDDDFDKTQLLENDHLNVYAKVVLEDGTEINAIDVGEYDIVISSYIVLRKENENDNDGIDVTRNYELITSDTNAKLTITPRNIDVKVWFVDTLSDYSSREYCGKEIDLKTEFPDYGPYTSTSPDDVWGIYSGDLQRINAVFTSDAELVELGLYQISVRLENANENDDVLRNYSIDTYTDGTLEITLRQVNVKPKMTAEQLVYDGSTVGEVESKWFNYDTSHNRYPAEAGFFEDSDKDYYNAVYTLYRVADGSEVSSDSILQAGDYYLEVTLKYTGAKDEEKYKIANEYQSEPFTVNKRIIYAVTPDVLPEDGTEFVYNKTAVSDPESYTTYWYVDGVLTEGGFVTETGDGEYATPIFEYVNKNGNSYTSAVHAGEYTIKIARFEGINGEVIIEDNYEVVDFPENEINAPQYGSLEIKRKTVIVVPTEYKDVEYDGSKSEITLPKANFAVYDPLYAGDGFIENGEIKLYEGDDLTFKTSGSVNIYKTYITMVRFTSVAIDSGDGVTDDYEIIYTYTELKKAYPELISQFTADKFVAELSFRQRNLYIEQFAPPEQYRKVQLGTNVKIELDNPRIPNDNIMAIGDGLVNGHYVMISVARAIAFNLEPVKDWIYLCKVYDKNGKDVSMGYNIIIDNEDETKYGDTYIKVVPKEIKVDVIRPLVSFSEGDTVDSSLYNVTGTFVFGETLEIKVEDGKFVACVTARTGEDNNHFYNITITYPDMGIEENVEKEAEYASRI